MEHDPKSLDHQRLAAEILNDQPVLVDKIAAAVPLERAEVPAMLTEVLRFLSLTSHADQVLTPPQLLDLAWHELILFTRTYAVVCERHFGGFVHHQPGGSKEENGRQLRTTLKLYGLYFGTPDRRFWGEHGYWSEPADCGVCDATSSHQE